MKKCRTSAGLQLMPDGDHFGSFGKLGQCLWWADARFGVLVPNAIRRVFSALKIDRTAGGNGRSDARCISGKRPEGLKRFRVGAPVGSRAAGREDVTLGMAVHHGLNQSANQGDGTGLGDGLAVGVHEVHLPDVRSRFCVFPAGGGSVPSVSGVGC